MNAHAVDEIANFWFQELSPEDWYKADAKRDAEAGGALVHSMRN
jgi:uncharacterized protein (DUF924 family)